MPTIRADLTAEKEITWCELKQNYASNDRIYFLFDYIDHAYTPDLTTLKVATDVGYCRRHLHRICKRETGYSVGDLIRIRKMDVAKSLLQDPDVSVKEVATKIGYSNRGHFALTFKQMFGCSPSLYADHACKSNVD